MKEIWKDIKGYEAIYQISNLGRVKSLARKDAINRQLKEKFLKPGRHQKGYLLVGLSNNGHLKMYKVHRLVAEAFVPNPDNKPQVNHKNGDKEFNFKYNLEWTTSSENIQHSYDKLGRKAPRGEDNGRARLTELDIHEIRKSTWSYIKLAKIYKVSQPHISDIKNYKSWRHI